MSQEGGTEPDPAIESAVVEAIGEPGIQDTLADLADAGIDQLLQEGFLRDVPAVGTVLGAVRATGSIRDLLLAKKLGRFLLELHRIPEKDRADFAQSHSSPKDKRRVGEALILLLDRLDDLEKPALVARVFGAYIRGRIDHSTFRLMASAIDRLHLPHLKALAELYLNGADEAAVSKLDRDVCQALAFAGLLRAEARGNGGAWFDPLMAGAVLVYTGNKLGETFVSIVADDA